jgi:hypothetical protein
MPDEIARCRAEQQSAQRWLDTMPADHSERTLCEMGLLDWLIEERLIDGRLPKQKGKTCQQET